MNQFSDRIFGRNSLLHSAKTFDFIIREHLVNIHYDQKALDVIENTGDELLEVVISLILSIRTLTG